MSSSTVSGDKRKRAGEEGRGESKDKRVMSGRDDGGQSSSSSTQPGWNTEETPKHGEYVKFGVPRGESTNPLDNPNVEGRSKPGDSGPHWYYPHFNTFSSAGIRYYKPDDKPTKKMVYGPDGKVIMKEIDQTDQEGAGSSSPE
ncbi:hypothetical protein HYFRA_00011664 [Hymenoscyphus fraxineus]|uniref:Uncharacterized protein n=1 Tax=Hymenoscyphus fraxineus TaxID=746836 RepID=A0A9N9KWS8_9HELO|nr:hypothetical protein HYFRA_00011664 [Hymenoscyphus fraxineus]